ncbi:hypothetical protein LX70_00762 [Defluviimonas denitrificans]|jgi:hypothetical protein|uniref:Lipoprotein n=1 Tax=Albidovulum denitrificans TaxID=404881 RepID=A0A2S8SDS3_9RHOB|nr:hypothetical protein [Defluviimonas denitrificans]PQV58943.1 hypothetical protein LX70_00762 [Defluviimonas denitrificans]
MVGASKILTVSYGTFSCTLEGFDEPFSTMKAIAEYFRDLAADDRYFGAVPPTPDAEMLHRIAEREINRRVEARVSEDGIVLRPEGMQAAPLPVAEPAPVAPAPAPAPVAEAPARPSVAESVAAKLARIRAVVNDAPVATAAAVAVPYEEDEATDEVPSADDAAETDFGFTLDYGDMPGLKAEDAAPEEVAEADTAEDDAALSNVMAAVETEETPVEEAVAEAEDELAEPQDDEAGIAAFAVTEETVTEDAVAEDAVAEDAVAEDAVADESADVEALIGALAAEEEVAEVEAPVEEIETEEEVEEIEAEEEVAEVEAPVAEVEEIEDEEDTAEFDADEDEDALEAFAEDEDIAALEALDGIEDEDEADAEAEAMVAFDDPTEGLDDEAYEDEADEEMAEDETPRASATVLRLSRADEADDHAYDDDAYDDDLDGTEDEAEAAFALSEDTPVEDRTAALMAALSGDDYDDEFEDNAAATEEDDNAILAQIGAAIGETGLPEDEEQELLRDLADATRELRRDNQEGRAILEGGSDDEDASVERLMEEAKSKLEGVENRRRFSAIAHLKAAVAATVADRKMKSNDAGVGAASEAADHTERYRDDLSKAVRPRRPAADSLPTTQRPTMATRMAPLVLVSEQRVDTAEEGRGEAAVVRPRRVRATVMESTVEADQDDAEDMIVNPEDARSFAEFAERLGASNLPELLEAAAAYTATVEGVEHFSRPHIIRKVIGMADEEDYSREDSLRSFGMLLRQGKIQKVSRGQFTLTDASRYMTEARRVAN